MPLTRVLHDMEEEGVEVRPEELKAYGDALVERIEELEHSIHKQAGEDFNINSPSSWEKSFSKNAAARRKKTKTGYSTAADVLDKLAPDYPYCFGDSGIPGADQAQIHLCGRTCGLYRGKQPDSYHTEPDDYRHGKNQLHGAEPAEHSHAYGAGASDPQGVCSQVRLCVYRCGLLPDRTARARHMSGDEQLIEAYRSDADIHRITAAKVFHTPFEGGD